MAFVKGKSGNPAGRQKGTVLAKVALANKLLEHGDEILSILLDEAIEKRMPYALNLCFDRLIPKMRYDALNIDLPKKIKAENMEEIKLKLAQAVLDGKMGASDAKIVQDMLMDNPDSQEPKEVDVSTITDEEAESMYKDVMNGKV